MKSKFIAIIAAASIMLAGCSSSIVTKSTGNSTHEYKPYGFMDFQTYQSSKVCYAPSVGDVILSIVFIETVVVPVLILGYDIMQPVGMKNSDGSCA